MSGLLQWIQGMQKPQAPPALPGPQSPLTPGMRPQYHDALQSVWQKYAPQGATPPLQGAGGMKPPIMPPPQGASSGMNPSSIRVDFHAPESANPQ